jgi:hypothetical protein
MKGGNVKKRLWLGACSVILVGTVAVPLSAPASSVDAKLQIGFSLHFTGPTSTAGTFVASGAVRDSGTSTVTNLTLAPQGNQDDARLTGTQTFIGQKGTITTTFDGLAGPLNDPHQAGKGTFKIVEGAGEYAGIKGHGTFVVVVDVSTNQVIGTEDGQAN